MRFKKTKTDLVFITCSGYPECKNTMRTPNGIKHLKMITKTCPNCKKLFRGDVKMFTLEFYSEFCTESCVEFLPDKQNTTGEFCVYDGCDKGFSYMILQTRNQPK